MKFLSDERSSEFNDNNKNRLLKWIKIVMIEFENELEEVNFVDNGESCPPEFDPH